MEEGQHAFHAMNAPDVMRFLRSSRNGLALADVDDRRAMWGANILPQPPVRAVWRMLFAQLQSPLMVVLVVACGLSLLLGDVLEALLIVGIVALHVVLGFVQEYRADRAFVRLAGYLPPMANVRRGGVVMRLSATDIVVGDVLVLRAGDRVAADARIFSATVCQASESALTGESTSVEKSAEMIAALTPVPEQTNVVFASTEIVYGKAEAVVVAVGSKTVYGRMTVVAEAVQNSPTPLQQKIRLFSRQLMGTLLVVCVVVSIFGVATGYSIRDMMLLSIALAVSAVPEGLLVTLTVILSLGMQRMLARKALVRRLVDAETLGSVDVMCIDKTGTITLGAMEVVELSVSHAVVLPSDPEATALLTAMRLGMSAEIAADGTAVGTPTESSMLRFLVPLLSRLPTARYRFIDEIPFMSALRFSARRYTEGREEYIVAMGAADALLPRLDCTDTERGILFATVERMANQGMRVIMIAERRGYSPSTFTVETITDLKVVGFVGLTDPLRPGVRATIAEAAGAGIRTVMITGDHPSTASAVARAIGLQVNEGSLMTGVELAHLSDEALRLRVERIVLFARIVPEDKLRIVRALQSLGHVVAMTGDGVNDVLSLRAADIGVAVGSGTDVAREAADIVLLNNDVATITAAVHEGRGLFDTIRKVIAYFLASSLTEIILMLGTLLLGLPLPLLPLHILWINVLADGLPSIALAAERPELASCVNRPNPVRLA